MRSPLTLLMSSSALLALLATGTAIADPLITRGSNSYGMPGAIDTPTAESFTYGDVGGALSYSDYARRNTLIFQASPRLTMALRYSKVDGIDDARGALYDRSLDVHYRLLDEQGWRPAVAVGMRDFLGTGTFSGEYVVATKNLTDKLRVSAGVGWGRLGGDARPFPYGDEAGKPNSSDWFTGEARPFGSVSYQLTDKLRLSAEYSNDRFTLEQSEGADAPDGHVNLGLNYRFGKYYEAALYTIGKDKIGAQLSFALNARQSLFPSGLEAAPAPVRPRPSRAADPEGWSGAWSSDATAQPAIQSALAKALDDDGIELTAMALSADRAEVRIANTRYPQQAQAVGRTARMMTRALPPSVQRFTITSVDRGAPSYSVTLNRADVERLENTNSTLIAERASITDADPHPGDLVATPGLFPRFSWEARPTFGLGIFDPDEPFRYELGAALSGRYELRPGLVLAGEIRHRIIGSQEQNAPEGYTVTGFDQLSQQQIEDQNNGYARVRSDTRMYAGNTAATLPYLTLSWYAKPSQTVYSRVTAGMLETAYGGVSAEALWWPANSRLALGAEVNHVKKRDYRDALAFRDFETTTGHLSAYYDLGEGIIAQVDAGRYLAGDWGATVSLTREFANGFRVGAFATKTDMSAEDFGNGSFDKGISVEIPLSWALGTPSKRSIGTTFHSLARDGGQRVNISGRLYDTVRDSHTGRLYQGWGKFWR